MLSLQPLQFGSGTSFAVARPGWLPTARVVTTAPVYDLDFQYGGADATSLSNAGFSLLRSGTAWDEWGNSYSTNTPRIIPGKGLLIEGVRTNSIRNNTMVGAVAGSTGTMPTNWSTNNGSGIARSVVGTGTLGGLTFIDIRFAGTTGDTTGQTISTESTTQIAAVLGQTWTGSAYVALVGGSLANITALTLTLDEREGAGVLLGSSTVSLFSTVTPSLQRFSLTRTLTNASTAFTTLTARASVSGSGVAVDFTLRIAAPVLEQGGFMSSPILTTNAGAVTRNADVCTATRSAATLLAGTTIVDAAMAPGAPPTGNHYMWVVSDGTTNNRVLLAVNTTPALFTIVTDGGVAQASVTAGSTTAAGGFKLAVRWTTNNVAAVVNGGTVTTDTSVTIPATMTAERIGADTSGTQQWMGYIKRIRRYAAAWSDSELQLATAGYDLNLASGESTAADLAAVGFTTTRATTAWDELGKSYASGVPRVVSGRGLLVENARTNLCLRSQEFANATWTKSGATCTDGAAIGPDGVTANATTFVESALNEFHNATQSVSFTSGTTYTYSVYAKPLAGTRFLRLSLSGSAFSTALQANFDLSTGAATTTSGAPTTAAVAIGRGWWRCSMTGAATSTASASVQVAMATSSNTNSSYAGDGTSGILLWNAQVVASSFLGTPIVTTSSTVTRNVDVIAATRAAGLLDRGSVVVGATAAAGLDVDQVAWTIDAGDVNNRLSLYRNVSTTGGHLFLVDTSVTQASLGTGSNTWLNGAGYRLAARWATDNVAFVGGGGTVGTDTAATLPAATVNERVGNRSSTDRTFNGYVRRIKRTTTLMTDAELQAASNGYDLPFALGATAADLAGAGFSLTRSTVGYDLWGNSYPANQPRITSQGLLLEGSRTQYVARSTELTNAYWANTAVTATTAAATAPDGTTTAIRMAPTAAVTNHYYGKIPLIAAGSIPDGTTVAFSVYAKAEGYSFTRLQVRGKDGTYFTANFNLTTGASSSVTSPWTASALAVGGGWWRCSLQGSVGSGSTAPEIFVFPAQNATDVTLAGDGTSGVLFWNTQFEFGAFPSSPMINNSGSTFTRAADVCTATRTASLLGQGSVLAEFQAAAGRSGYPRLLQLDDASGNNRVSLYREPASGLIGLDAYTSGVQRATASSVAAVADNASSRVACAFSSSRIALSLSGATVVAAVPSAWPAATVERLGGEVAAGSEWFGYIRRITRTGETWTDAQLKAFSYGAVL